MTTREKAEKLEDLLRTGGWDAKLATELNDEFAAKSEAWEGGRGSSFASPARYWWRVTQSLTWARNLKDHEAADDLKDDLFALLDEAESEGLFD